MTTSLSPIVDLQRQARIIAGTLKQRAELDQAKPTVAFGIAMDDKVFRIEMAWAKIRETEEAALAEFVLKHMRGDVEKTN